MSIAKVTLIAAISCFFFATAADAQRNTNLTMVWRIVPQEKLEPAKFVGSNDIVTRARIIPMAMVVTTTSVKSVDGEELLPSGTQLALLQGSSRVACHISIANRREILGLPVSPPKNKYLCFMDMNSDGAFESTTRLYSPLMTAFVGVFRQPKPKQSLVPTPYVVDDPLKWEGNEFVEFSYLGKKSGTYRFGMTPRRQGDNNVVLFHVRADQKLDSDRFPTRFEAFGAQFEILELERGKPKIRALTPFPASPFVVRGIAR